MSGKQQGAVWRKDSYDRLYDQVKGGKRTVCYVDYNFPNDPTLPVRDICTIRPNHMEFTARGIGYGGAGALLKGEDEKTFFLKECERLNVEWLDESGIPAAGNDAVEFFEWASLYMNGYKTEEEPNRELTSTQLYELFKQRRGDESATPAAPTINQDAHEKEIMMRAFDKVRQIFEGRQWIMEGRGSYPFNDDRYKEEVRYMYDEFDQVFKDTWANIKSKSIEYKEKIIAEYLNGDHHLIHDILRRLGYQKTDEVAAKNKETVNPIEFHKWIIENNWEEHSSKQYWHRSKNRKDWPPDETCEKSELVNKFKQQKQSK